MKRIASAMLLALAALVVLIGAATPASAAPTITQIQALGPPGGYLTQPNGDGGIFNLYLYAGTASQNGAILNPAGGVNYPLPDGTHNFTLRGTAGATGPIFYLNLWFNGNYGPVDIAVNTTSPVSSTTIDGRVVKVTNFTWLNDGQPNLVGVDFPSPDGYWDSVGEFTLEVSTPFPSGLVSWWRAEGNFADSFDGNTGFPVNTVNFVPGKVGQAFSFNGSAMRVPSSANLNFGTGNFSGSMWVKTTVGGGFIVEKDIPGVNNPDWFVHLTGGRVRFVVGQGAGGGDPSVTSAARVDDGNFHHLAWVRNGTSLSVYIDGVLSGQANAAFVGNVSNGVQFVIGAEINNDATNNLINTSVSVIDEVAIFNRALSAADILGISGDLQPPVISLNGANPMILECPVAYFEPGASASDSFDPSPSLDISGSVDSHTPGSYTITYTASDDAGNTSSATRTVNVVDTTPPVIALNGANPVVVECHLGAYTEAGATALDACDGDRPVAVSGAVDADVVGTYTLTYTATDSHGNTASTARTVNVVDTTPPVISLNSPDIPVIVECHLGALVDPGATALDACDGAATVSAANDVNIDVVGAYSITYSATDSHGNTATATRPVQVVDTTPPVVSLNSPDIPVIVECHLGSLADPGATALDACDGTATVSAANDVDIDVVGTYLITYTATDASGNSASATRTVNVVDTTPPAISFNDPDTQLRVECHIGTLVDPGATALDACDGLVTVSASNNVNIDVVGTYLITYSATDAHGNTSSATRTVTVGDATPPVVTLSGEASVTIECHVGTYTEEGATALDACDGNLAVASAGTVNTEVPGIYTLSYTATDHSGNAGNTVTRTVNVVDTTPPVLTLNGSNPLLLELGTSYPEAGATASDLCDGDLSGNIQISGGVNPDAEGSYTVTYSVADAAGNTTSASRTVQVVVTANSYGLIATHSLHLRQNARVLSGFAGVVNRGQAPFLAGKVELVVGTRVQTAQDVRLSAPRVRVRQHAAISGELVYNQLVAVGKHATIGQQTPVGPEYFPLFQGFGLPAFQTGTPGAQDVEVRQKGSATLSAGAYDEVRVKQKGTLTFTGGTYQLGDLEVGQQAKVIFLAPTTLLIRGQLSLDQRSSFGPGSGIGAADILVYVEGRNGRLGNHHDDDEGDDEEDDAEGRRLRQSPRSVKIGEQASFQGNLYAPNGTIHLRQGSTAVGSFIGRDVIVGVRVQVAAQSGWNTPGVIYQPQAPVALAKLAGTQGETAALPEGTGLLANYPNPFNPSTTVPYVLAEAGLVRLSIYNVLGQQIRVLVDQLQAPGAYTVSWDGMDASGLQVAGGVYFYRLEAGDHLQVKKMLFAK